MSIRGFVRGIECRSGVGLEDVGGIECRSRVGGGGIGGRAMSSRAGVKGIICRSEVVLEGQNFDPGGCCSC